MFPKPSFAAACCLTLSVVSHVNGFQRMSSACARRQTTSLGLTNEEILARARKASGIPEEEPAPKIFEDKLLNDMQSALIKLERRVNDGPGSLSILDTEELDLEFKRIIDDMYRNAHKRIPRPAPIIDVTPGASNSVTLAVPKPVAQGVPAVKAAPVAKEQKPVTDTSLDEGPVFDGKGGMGQPRGTVNTYIIDGMDEMSPEEYQKALQASIIERQRQRRASKITGNKASWDYLSSLGAATGPQGSKSDKNSFKPFPGKS